MNQLDGGGERKGMVGIVVGMFGIEGIVVGMLGSVGKDGIRVLGNGGNVGFGRFGCVGRVGRGVFGRGGSAVGLGNVGIEGNGGNVTFGRVGMVGSGAAGACKSWRAARLISKLDNDNATSIDNRKQCLKPAIFSKRKEKEQASFYLGFKLEEVASDISIFIEKKC